VYHWKLFFWFHLVNWFKFESLHAGVSYQIKNYDSLAIGVFFIQLFKRNHNGPDGLVKLRRSKCRVYLVHTIFSLMTICDFDSLKNCIRIKFHKKHTLIFFYHFRNKLIKKSLLNHWFIVLLIQPMVKGSWGGSSRPLRVIGEPTKIRKYVDGFLVEENHKESWEWTQQNQTSKKQKSSQQSLYLWCRIMVWTWLRNVYPKLVGDDCLCISKI